MIKVGLTGNIGSGKSAVSGIFAVLNIPVYNADERAKYILDSPLISEKMIKTFGEQILGRDQKPDRKKIAGIVFAHPVKLRQLNGIIHPMVLADFKKWTREQKNADYVVMESAILFETGYSSLFDKIIFVSAPETVRLKRVMERDKVTAAQVKIRMRQQKPEKDKIRKSDFVIVNKGKKSLIQQVLSIHRQIL
jgi:dephospho-CoA kinase